MDRGSTHASFRRAYDGLVAASARASRTPLASTEIPTDFGRTHLLEAGDAGAPPVLLIPGGGATAGAWAGVAQHLASDHRVLAVDPVGQAGLSTSGGRPLRGPSDVTAWLDQVLEGLGVGRTAVVGHSYGGWMALRHALDTPARVRGLVLVDPTDCFVPLSLRYRLRALPLVLRPSAARLRGLLAWETAGRPVDPGWLSVAAVGADLGRPQVVLPRRPSADDLAAFAVPTLVLVAAESRAHSPERLARRVSDTLGHAEVVSLPDATHHTLPTEHADALAGAIRGFLTRAA